MQSDFNVSTDSYVTDYKYLSDNIVLMNRVNLVNESKSIPEVFCNFWGLGFISLNKSKINIWSNGKIQKFQGDIACFVPPFSPVVWQLEKGEHKWTGIFSTAPLPKDIPKGPIYFQWDGQNIPDTQDKVIQLIQQIPNFISYPIDSPGVVTGIAIKVKKLLDQTYLDDISLQEIAKELRLSPAVMTRAFKSSFGLTPQHYYSQLRIFNAVEAFLFQKGRASEVFKKVGFGDRSRFHKQFKKYLNATPSAYYPG